MSSSDLSVHWLTMMITFRFLRVLYLPVLVIDLFMKVNSNLPSADDTSIWIDYNRFTLPFVTIINDCYLGCYIFKFLEFLELYIYYNRCSLSNVKIEKWSFLCPFEMTIHIYFDYTKLSCYELVVSLLALVLIIIDVNRDHRVYLPRSVQKSQFVVLI